jgi:hypothetical protein
MKKQAVNPTCITMDGVSAKKKSATDLPVRMLTIKIKIANQRWAADAEPVINKYSDSARPLKEPSAAKKNNK